MDERRYSCVGRCSATEARLGSNGLDEMEADEPCREGREEEEEGDELVLE